MPQQPQNLFSIEDAPSGGFEIGDERPDFAANPPGMPAPPNAILQSPEARAIDQARQAAIRAHGTYGPGVPAGYYEQPGTGPYQGPVQTPKETAVGAAKVTGMAAAAAVPVLFPPASILGRIAVSGLASGTEAKLAGASYPQAALAAGIGAAGQGAGEGLVAFLNRVPAAAKFIPRLLNASGKVAPETLENLTAAEPVLRAGGAPKSLTQAGMAEHLTNLSQDIQGKIAPVIEQAATKDVSASTAQIAQRIRADITPEMRRINPGTANILEKFAKGAEESKDLASLDQLRKQIELRKGALKPGSVGKPYLANALNDVLDAIAEHVQQVRPDLAVRSMRTQQSALMKLANTFEESAAKGAAQQASQQALTVGQKVGQKLPDLVQAAMNPKAALAKKLVQPSTAEQILQQAFKGIRPTMPARPQATFPEESLNAIREGGAETRRSSAQFIQDVIQRRGLPTDPRIADIEAAVKGRAAEMAAKYPVPQYQPIRDPFAPPATPQDVYTPKVVEQHATALEQAKQQLPNGSLSEILQLAAKIQRGGP